MFRLLNTFIKIVNYSCTNKFSFVWKIEKGIQHIEIHGSVSEILGIRIYDRVFRHPLITLFSLNEQLISPNLFSSLSHRHDKFKDL